MLALCLMLSKTYYAQSYAHIIGLSLSIAQASFSFKHLDTHRFTYTTPTFITEVLRLITHVQLLLTNVTMN